MDVVAIGQVAGEKAAIGGEPLLDPSTSGLRLSDERIVEISAELSFAPPDPCPSCGNHAQRRIADVDRYGFPLTYVACHGCGLVFANPYYDAKSLDRFYTRHYAPIYGRTARPENMFRAERERGRRVAALLDRYARAGGRSYASCLDLGCSHGGFLAALPANWTRVGYDYDESLFTVGRKHGLELRPITRLDDETRRFDVIMANQVLEHTADPVAFLQRLAGFLSPGGVIYIEVPGLRAPAAAHIDVRLMFKNAHRWMFEAATLRALAARAGLTCTFVNENVQVLLIPGAADGQVTETSVDRTLDYIAARVVRPGATRLMPTARLRRVRDALGRLTRR